MSLHLIELVDGVVRCGCKAFLHSLVCKHSLAAEHALQMRDLLAKVKPLKETKRGRGSKAPKAMPALVRQPRVDDNSDVDGGEGSDGEQEPAAQPPLKRPRAHKNDAQLPPPSPRGSAAAMLTPSEVDAFYLFSGPAPQAGVKRSQFIEELEGAEIIMRIWSETEGVAYIERGTPALLEAADALMAELRAAERRAPDAAAELRAKHSLEKLGRGGVSVRAGRGSVAGTRNGGGAAGGGRWQSRGKGAREGAKPRSRSNCNGEGTGVMRL